MTTLTSAQQIAAIQNNIQTILANYQTNKSLLGTGSKTASSTKPDNPADWNSAPPRQIRSLQQSTSDTQTDTMQTARSIGDLTGGKTRLNVFSALTANDKVDFFSFNQTTAGKVGASVSSDKGVHVQILKANGTVIADSEAKFGDKADNYKDLAASKLYLDKATYYIKVTRSTGTTDGVKPNYAIQLSMGKNFGSDYDTIESAASNAATTFASTNAQATANVSSILNTLGGGNLFDFLT